MKIKNLLFLILSSITITSNAQTLEKSIAIIKELCSEKYSGRGYVNNGVNKASEYLQGEYHQLKLKKFGNSYAQTYSFPVNTFPSPIFCKLDNKEVKVGYDFLVDASSPSVNGNFNLLHFNTSDSLDNILLYKKIKKGFDDNSALVLHQTSKRGSKIMDSLMYYHHFPSMLIYTESKKLTHTISDELDKLPTLIFIDSALKNKEQISVQYQQQIINHFESKNLIGYIKAKKSDSFIVFSAHYDHLGMLGKDALFPGASDNASGTSMVLYLAEYFTIHKPKDNIVFILFSGEEAGLLGSEYFIQNPTFNLNKIKMLVNIDIMGSAQNGVTVVNGELYKKQFDVLTKINNSRKYLPEVKIRGKAKNSDHYYFSEKNIPSFFIYSNGGKGHYHDVFDKADQLDLINYEEVAKLLIEFVQKI